MTQVLTKEAPQFVLAAPEVITPMAPEQAAGVVQLKDELKSQVSTQVSTFVATLTSSDVHSEEFRTNLDKAFSVGRKEIGDSTTLTNGFTKRNFVGEIDSPAFKAINEMRTIFDEFNPANQGNLAAPVSVLGIPIPFTNKLKSFLRRYESAQGNIETLQGHVIATKDNIGKTVAELGRVRDTVYDALQKLEAVVYFISETDRQLSAHIAQIGSKDAERARALEKEVLYYIRQNLGDVQSAQALAYNTHTVMGELRKTGRETMNACDRIATLGIAALSMGVTVARATGVQVQGMQAVQRSKQSIENLILANGKAMKDHAQATADFASNPVLGVATIQQMFADTEEAMAITDNFRSAALVTMKANNDMLQGMLDRQKARLGNEKKALAAPEGITL